MNELKSSKINLRVTPSEKEKLYNNAKLARMSVSQYIMTLADEKKIYVVDCVPELVIKISRIGVNINQITHVANSQKFVSRPQLNEIQSSLKEIISMMSKFLEILNKDNDEVKDLKALNKAVRDLSEKIEEQKNGNSQEN